MVDRVPYGESVWAPFLPQESFSLRKSSHLTPFMKSSLVMVQAPPKAGKLPHLCSAPNTEEPSRRKEALKW